MEPSSSNTLLNRFPSSASWGYLPPAASATPTASIVDQLVSRGPEVENERGNTQQVWTTLGHKHAHHLFLWIDLRGSAEGAVPAEAPGNARKVAARGAHPHAEAPSHDHSRNPRRTAK